MQDAVDALADRLDLREVGEIRRLEFLACAEIGGRLEVAQEQIRIDRRQQLAQAGADPPRRAGHQYAWHFVPRLCSVGMSMAWRCWRRKMLRPPSLRAQAKQSSVRLASWIASSLCSSQ